ncbi:MAG: outer membrane beta-barrel protein [Betaproteobacteria bacterium]|nr:outer membrane beta-barrel protein [Betaproteobacteria bacterium]
MMRQLVQALALAGLLGAGPGLVQTALADTAAAGPKTPTLSDIFAASGITESGYIDIGYSALNSTGLFVTGGNSRVFDTPKASAGHDFNSFNLNQAALTLAKQPASGFGGLVNVTLGQDATVIQSYGATSAANFDLTQAYGSYATGPVTVIAGKFATLAGAELIASPQDTNYSRSILFGYAIPFTHTGVRVTYAPTSAYSLIAGVNNGWDQVSSQQHDKTIELGFTAAPNKMFSLAGSYYGGKELTTEPAAPTATSALGMRNLFDVVATLNATDKLTFIVNGDYGTQDNASLADANGASTAKWTGVAGYVNYQLAPTWRLSVRGEYFNDKDGYRTGIAQKWKEGTVTVAYLPAPSYELRGEIRHDWSNQAAFLRSDGTAGKSQTSLGLEALYKF